VADAMAALDPNGYRIPPVPGAQAPVTDPNGTVQDFHQTPEGGFREGPLQAVPQLPAAQAPEGQVQDIELPPAAQAASPAPPTDGTPGTSPPNGVVTVTGADGQPVRVALSGLSPAKRAEYSAVDTSGMADVNAYGRGVAKDWAGIRRDQGQAADAERDAIRQQANTLAIRQDEEYRLRKEAQTREARDAADAADDQVRYDAITRQRDGDVQRLIAEQGQMTFDPDRYTKSQGAGQSILNTIGIALGGIGQALVPGSRNIALDMLNQAIERDIQAQHEAYNRKGAQVGQAKDAYSRARQNGMDHNQATLAARQVALQQLETGLKVVGSKYASAETAANRDMALAHVGSERAKTNAEYAKAVHAEAQGFVAMRQQQRQFAYQQDYQQKQLDLEREKFGVTLEAARMKGKQPMTIPGLQGQAATPETLTKAQATENAYQDMMPMIDELRQLRKEYGGEAFPTKAAARAKSLATQLQLQAKNMYQLGAISGADLDMLTSIIPEDPLARFSLDDTVLEKLGTFREQAQKVRRSNLRTYGFEAPADRPAFDEQPLGGEKAE
jgi:hypothetical protein